ncbi:unnamed protein product [Mytilus coruscus]|uniref:Uncharacterized protein n=1 Tax=Mytilus coruscus TaxID=42192 RepID=A0A6J8AJ63_MYTCO|nr:unnamed protein product [Mytilus coruscus]
MKETVDKTKLSENHTGELLKKTINIETQIYENKNCMVNKHTENLKTITEHISRAKDYIITSLENVQIKDIPVPTAKLSQQTNTEDKRHNTHQQNVESEQHEENDKNKTICIVGSSVVKDLDGRKIYRNRIRITTLRDKTIQRGSNYIQEKKINNETSVIML